jgi:hypothetical protein
MMKTKWIEESFTYDGTQLRPLFSYMNHGLLGDSIVSWQGPCEIPFEHMVDGEDLREESPICGGNMLHFIIEKFETSLFAAVSLQRLLASLAIDLLNELNPSLKGLFRTGDDIFIEDKKLSISIATQSPTSSMIHFAVNITNEGTPVKTLSLEDLNINPISFSKKLMERFSKEVLSIQEATQKVYAVR